MRISLSAVLMTFVASACGTTPAPGSPEPAPRDIRLEAPDPAPRTLQVTPVLAPSSQMPEPLNAQAPPLPDAVTALLTYAERLRQLTPSELTAEIALQGDPGNVPLRQMQLAMALMQTPQAVDTARALAMLQRVVGSQVPEATPLKPLARLLAHRLMEQRRLEDTVERQGQQLRESQRRVEQLTDRLEAMRAIERSLTTRPPVPSRPATP